MKAVKQWRRLPRYWRSERPAYNPFTIINTAGFFVSASKGAKVTRNAA